MDATTKFWIDIIAAGTMPISILAVTWNRNVTKKGLGASSLRFLALGVIVPAVLVLGVEGVLDAGALGATFGAIVGYLFGKNDAAEKP